MNAHVDPLTQIPLKLIDSFSSVVLLSPFAEELGLNRHHGTEETSSSRFPQEGPPEEEGGQAPQEVQASQQEEGDEEEEVPQEEAQAFQEGRRRVNRRTVAYHIVCDLWSSEIYDSSPDSSPRKASWTKVNVFVIPDLVGGVSCRSWFAIYSRVGAEIH